MAAAEITPDADYVMEIVRDGGHCHSICACAIAINCQYVGSFVLVIVGAAVSGLLPRF